MMSFYCGDEIKTYREKFEAIKKWIIHCNLMKTDYNAEAFRFIIDRFYEYVLEEEEKENEMS